MGEEINQTPADRGGAAESDEASGESHGATSLEPGYTTPKRKRPRSLARSIGELIVIAACAVIIAYLMQLLVVKPFLIPSGSMEHTLDIGDRVLVFRQAYRFSDPQRGDIIVFPSPLPEDHGEDLIKRIIAVGGDTVQVIRGQVILNGQPQVEPYVNGTDTSSFGPVTIPPGNVFLMGDNRADSKDSRFWPTPWLSEQNIIGKAFMIYWPLNRLTWFG